jgi:hypothetical protein
MQSALNPHGTLLLYVPITYKRFFPWTETIEQKYLSDFLYKYHDDFSMHRYTANEVLKKIQQGGFNIKSTEYAYGVCGVIALELSFLILASVKRLPAYISLVFVLIYACAVFPVQLVLMLIDFVLPKSTGNGLLIIAEKAHNSSSDSSG